MRYFISLVIAFQSLVSYSQTKPFDDVLQHYQTKKNFNGAVIVATDGKIDYLNAVGIANRQTAERITTQTKFKIASVTKAFTAVIILQLYEKGLLDLQTTFGKYFTNYTGEAKDKVTIENLLTYSSGIPNEADSLGMKSYQTRFTLDEYIDKFCSGALETTPGTKSNYSNVEYIILQKIIENITHKSFEAVLKEQILTPLKMNNTGVLDSKIPVAGLTNAYTIDDSTRTITLDESYLPENFFASGAMYATVEDLLKFNIGIFNHELLSKKNTELLIAPHPKLDNVAFGFWYAGGYGTFSKPFVYRTGGILGACSNWIHTLEDKKTIILCNNTNGTNLYEMSEQLYLISTGQKATVR